MAIILKISHVHTEGSNCNLIYVRITFYSYTPHLPVHKGALIDSYCEYILNKIMQSVSSIYTGSHLKSCKNLFI